MKKIKKRRKFNWLNILLLIILLICIYIICHDLFIVTIYGWITGNMHGWTWFGFGTFILAFITGGAIIDYFIDQINKK